MFLWCVRYGWRDILSKRGLLLPISSSRSQVVPTLAPPCKLVRDASFRLRVPRSTAILCTLPKSDRVIFITWSPSGYTPVQPECPDVPLSSCLPIKMWQLSKGHGVTRNEPKIHVICYITYLSMLFFKMSAYRHFLPVSLHLPSTPYTKQKNYLSNSKNNTILKQLGDLFSM